MWYKAAQFDTEELAGRAYFPLLNALKQHGRSVSLFRLKEPYRAVVALCDTPPSQELETLIKSYLAQGKVIPLPKDIIEMLYEKRKAGISQAAPLPDSSALGYEHHTKSTRPFTGTIDQVSPGIPLQPGSKVKMQVIPFIVGYQQLSAMRSDEYVNYHIQDVSPERLNAVDQVVTLINQVNGIRLKSAEKYIFTDSALRMHTSVYQPDVKEWMLPGMHTWIELQTSINTPYGERVKAMYFYNAYPLAEIDRTMPVSRDKNLHTLLTRAYNAHAHHWSLDIINERCETVIDFTYDETTHQVPWFSDHICPHKQCAYPVPPNPNTLDLGICAPCAYCKQAASYWFSWLSFAHKMIQGDYAVTPEQPQWSYDRQEYQQEELVRVGHGKNQRKIKQQATRHVDYTVVSFDVSIKRPGHPIEPTEAHEKRANWLTAINTDDIIYERRAIPDHSRRYPTRRDGTRLEGRVPVHYEQPKYVPMLRPEKRRSYIKKVVAKQYEQQS